MEFFKKCQKKFGITWGWWRGQRWWRRRQIIIVLALLWHLGWLLLSHERVLSQGLGLELEAAMFQASGTDLRPGRWHQVPSGPRMKVWVGGQGRRGPWHLVVGHRVDIGGLGPGTTTPIGLLADRVVLCNKTGRVTNLLRATYAQSVENVGFLFLKSTQSSSSSVVFYGIKELDYVPRKTHLCHT